MKINALLAVLFIGYASNSIAQLSPLKSQYFQNEYLVNPAMAGKDNRTNVFVNYSSQWGKIEGSPVLMSLSGSTTINENMAVGLNLISDKAGLMQKVQAMGSFAYILPLGDDHSLRVGMSLGWGKESLDMGAATKSGTSDVALSNFNDNRKGIFDGNVGVAYAFKGIEAQFSYLSINQKRANDLSTVDYSTFYSSLAYEFSTEGSFSAKPLLAYRGVKDFKNQWDAAVEWGFADMINLYTMYHSNKSFSGGVGYHYQDKLNFSAIYNSEPNQVKGYTGGIFDLVVGYSF
jgi:type IX secretion system PorP/SprF family membrane protein